MLRDEFLIQRCLGGEKEAFGQLVDKYKDAVHGLVYSKVPNFHDAQDIAQEVFIDAYRNLRSLRYPHRFSSWIYTITANHCWTWLRKRSRESSALASLKESQGILQEQATCQGNRERQVLDRLLDAIDKLPETSRLVMMLYYVNGLTCKEIGEFTGTSINTVMSKLRRAREKLRKEFIEMPSQAVTQRRVHSSFTTEILHAIEQFSPVPQTPSNPISRIIRIPWAVGLIICLVILGTLNISQPGSLYGARERETIVGVYPVLIDSYAVVDQPEKPTPDHLLPSSGEDELYDAEGSEADNGEDLNDGLQCKLSPGDILTYKLHKEVLDGDRLSHTVEGTRILLVKQILQDGIMQIIKIAQENLIIPGRREVVPHGDIGLMYVGRDGRDMRKARDESTPGYMDFHADLQQIDGYLYSVPFPQTALRQGDTWVAIPSDESVPESRYTVVGFEETKGYNCVILDREQTISITRKVKSRIACDIQSGMIVRLDAEVKIDKHAEKGNEKPQYSTQRVSAELIEWEQLDQEVLVFEKQVFDQIESAFAEHRFFEPDALRSKLKEIKKQYPTTRLAPGLEEMIREADRIIATRAQDAKREYTYRNHTYTIARLLIIQYEITGKYTKRVPGASMPESKRTPFYEYEIVDIEGSGPDSKCKIVARGKKATPAEGEAWYRTVSASEGIGEIKPYVNE